MQPATTILEDGKEIVLIHFVIQDGTRIACTPNLEVLSANRFRSVPVIRSDNINAVTCPVCKRTNDFRKAEVDAKR
jgi:hypothetical protein